MATTTIVPGNVYVAALHDIDGNRISGNSVSGTTINHRANKAIEIFSARIEYNYINAIGGILFKSKGETPEDKPRRIRDLKKIQKVITVTGLLDDETSLKGITKRINLLDIAENERALTLVWGNGNYRTIFDPDNDKGVFILKMRFRETAGIYGVTVAADPQPLTKHDIEIQFITGKDL